MNTTTLLLKTVLSAFDVDGLAHACAMEVEDNHGAEYATVQQFDNLLGDCMDAILAPPACNSARFHVSTWTLVEPAFGTVEMSSEQYSMQLGCEDADAIQFCADNGKIVITCD